MSSDEHSTATPAAPDTDPFYKPATDIFAPVGVAMAVAALPFIWFLPVLAFVLGCVALMVATRAVMYSHRKVLAIYGFILSFVSIFLGVGPTFLG